MVVGASAPADTLQVRQTTMECTGRSKVSGPTVSIAAFPAAEPVPMSRYSVLSGPHAPTTGQARSPAPAGRTWPPALLVLCTNIHRFSRSREGRPRRSRRDNAGCCRSWGGARGRWGQVSWSVAAAFDRQGKAIGCEPPARDERACPPDGEPLRVYGYRSFCPLCGRDGFACGETPTSLGSETRTSGEPPVVRSLRAHALHSALFTFGHE